MSLENIVQILYPSRAGGDHPVTVSDRACAPTGFRCGDLVRHSKFGRGWVVGVRTAWFEGGVHTYPVFHWLADKGFTFLKDCNSKNTPTTNFGKVKLVHSPSQCRGVVPPDSLGSAMLLAGKPFADVTLLVGPELVAIEAHRCVLSSRSDYFRAMFRTGAMQEGSPVSGSSEISLPHEDPWAVATLVEFLYTGNLGAAECLNTPGSGLESKETECLRADSPNSMCNRGEREASPSSQTTTLEEKTICVSDTTTPQGTFSEAEKALFAHCADDKMVPRQAAPINFSKFRSCSNPEVTFEEAGERSAMELDEIAAVAPRAHRDNNNLQSKQSCAHRLLILLALADKFQLPTLVTACLRLQLPHCLAPNTFGLFFGWADSWKNTDAGKMLTDYCREYFKRERSAILADSSFSEVRKDHAAAVIALLLSCFPGPFVQ